MSADKYLNGAGTQKLIGSILTELNKKQDKSTGKTLTTNDFTDNLKSKLDRITDGAQINRIENIMVNGSIQPISNKQVTLTIPYKTSELANDANFATVSQVSEAVARADQLDLTQAQALVPILEQADSLKSELQNLQPGLATATRDGYQTKENYAKQESSDFGAQKNPEIFQKGRWIYVRYNGQIIAGPLGPLNVDPEINNGLYSIITSEPVSTGTKLTAHLYQDGTEVPEDRIYRFGCFKWYKDDMNPKTDACLSISNTFTVPKADHGVYRAVFDTGVPEEEPTALNEPSSSQE